MKQNVKRFRLTPQRELILRLLKDDTTHPSAKDVYGKVREYFPNISFKTVYNTLEVLRDSKLIQELNVDSREKRYCPDPSPHHHIVCVQCKKVVDIKVEFNMQLPKKHTGGFRIAGNTVTFYGTCPECSIAEYSGRSKCINVREQIAVTSTTREKETERAKFHPA